MDTTIVDASLQDYESFVQVYTEVEKLHRENVSWRFKKPEGELFSKEYFGTLIQDSTCKFLFAKREGKVIGYVKAFIKGSATIPVLKSRRRVEVDDLSVLEKHRSTGVGSLLMGFVEHRAKENMIREVELNVYSFNQNAIDFYAHRGYDPVSMKMRRVIV